MHIKFNIIEKKYKMCTQFKYTAYSLYNVDKINVNINIK